MSYKPTGRPPGRPRTSELESISIKVPRQLLARVKRYAGLHRQTISELAREGLEWRITDGDPRGMGLPPSEDQSIMNYGNTINHTEQPFFLRIRKC